MLHTKFHGNLTTGSGGEDVEGILPYTQRGGHLGLEKKLSFPLPKEAPHKIWL